MDYQTFLNKCSEGHIDHKAYWRLQQWESLEDALASLYAHDMMWLIWYFDTDERRKWDIMLTLVQLANYNIYAPYDKLLGLVSNNVECHLAGQSVNWREYLDVVQKATQELSVKLSKLDIYNLDYSSVNNAFKLSQAVGQVVKMFLLHDTKFSAESVLALQAYHAAQAVQLMSGPIPALDILYRHYPHELILSIVEGAGRELSTDLQ